ncbi:MAG: DUF3015 family protein [Bdellovibrionales bacterium]|nr:DUF3015 family protein [Bdellovibrionales bacterium]
MKKIITIVLFFIGSYSFAGDSGCGLGSMIISKNTKLLQLFSLTTNNSSFSQPLGITFGTSGCSANGIVMNEKQVQYYVEVNQEDLSREMAQGHGEKLETLALLKGCQSPASQKAFAGFTQSAYAQIIPHANTNATEMVHNLNQEMAQQAELNQLCHGS